MCIFSVVTEMYKAYAETIYCYVDQSRELCNLTRVKACIYTAVYNLYTNAFIYMVYTELL